MPTDRQIVERMFMDEDEYKPIRLGFKITVAYAKALQPLDPISNDILDKILLYEELSNKTLNLLTTRGIYTLGQLVKFRKKQILEIPGLGRNSLLELKELLNKYEMDFRCSNKAIIVAWIKDYTTWCELEGYYIKNAPGRC